MPSSRRIAIRSTGGRVAVPVAAATWLVTWLAANVAGAVMLAASGADNGDTAAIWVLFAAQLIGWTIFVAGMRYTSTTRGTGDFVADYQVRARPIDIWGAAAGVGAQLVLVPLLYRPLRELWPATFDEDKISESARELADRASGGSMVLLVLMVCVGAPIVEELVYRGLIQGALANRTHQAIALVVASAWFALIHFEPVQYPGLFVAGLVFGACALVSGRLGPAIAAHAGFNVVGLVLALD